MSRDVVLQQLDERSAAYRAEAERLRAEAERITGLLAVCEAELERLVTARQVVGEPCRPLMCSVSEVLACVEASRTLSLARSTPSND
jgi:hypothetical protein